jgi:hypothetical protein
MARALLGAVLFAGALGGCVLVSGGTDGYKPVDAGIPGCGATSDCDPGQLCCLVLSLSSGSATVACQTPDARSVCTGGDYQLELCSTDAECPHGGACLEQQCSAGSTPTTFRACGTISKLCAIVPRSGTDAASPSDAASPTDAASAADGTMDAASGRD